MDGWRLAVVGASVTNQMLVRHVGHISAYYYTRTTTTTTTTAAAASAATELLGSSAYDSVFACLSVAGRRKGLSMQCVCMCVSVCVCV